MCNESCWGKGNLGLALQDWARDLQSLAGNFTFLAVNLELTGIFGIFAPGASQSAAGCGGGPESLGIPGNPRMGRDEGNPIP